MLPGILILNSEELVAVRGVFRKSATTAETMRVVAVCSIANCWVFKPTGTRPKIARRQNAATPSASVTSANEKADVDRFTRSPTVNLGVTGDSAELNGDNVTIKGIHSGSMRWLESDLGHCLEGVIVIIDSSLAGWTELDSFYKCVLRNRRWIPNRILERS